MKVVIDENLPRRLVQWLGARGCEASHVVDLGLQGANDDRIWNAAQERGAAILTRDADFIDMAHSRGGGVIRLTIGNCTTSALLTWLEPVWSAIEKRWDAGERVVEHP